MNDWQTCMRTTVAFLGLTIIASLIAQSPNTGQVSGHVVDSAEAAINGANIFVRKNMPSEDQVRLVAHTDIHGDFVTTLTEGGYDILVTSPGFFSGVETIPVWRGKTKKFQWKLRVLGCDFPGMNCDTFR